MKDYSRRSKKGSDPSTYAFRLLSRKDYSEFELRHKLEEHFDKESAGKVIANLIERGLLSDERYVERVIQKYAFEKKYGFLKVEAELYKKGIYKDIFRQKLSELVTPEIEREIALKLLSKKPKDKIRAYLLSRGFRPHIVQEVLADKN